MSQSPVMVTTNLLIKRIDDNDPVITQAVFQLLPLNDTQVEWLAKGLTTNTHVTYLNLNDCNLSDPSLKLVIEAIKGNSSLERVAIDQIQSDDPVHMKLLSELKSVLTNLDHNNDSSSITVVSL
tara:strand:+ start:573 stop:944 length:372 start_codon:yes stop_codon:yes gene_type:complete